VDQCRRVVFELEGFGLKSFWKDTSISLYNIYMAFKLDLWELVYLVLPMGFICLFLVYKEMLHIYMIQFYVTPG